MMVSGGPGKRPGHAYEPSGDEMSTELWALDTFSPQSSAAVREFWTKCAKFCDGTSVQLCDGTVSPAPQSLFPLWSKILPPGRVVAGCASPLWSSVLLPSCQNTDYKTEFLHLSCIVYARTHTREGKLNFPNTSGLGRYYIWVIFIRKYWFLGITFTENVSRQKNGIHKTDCLKRIRWHWQHKWPLQQIQIVSWGWCHENSLLEMCHENDGSSNRSGTLCCDVFIPLHLWCPQLSMLYLFLSTLLLSSFSLYPNQTYSCVFDSLTCALESLWNPEKGYRMWVDDLLSCHALLFASN